MFQNKNKIYLLFKWILMFLAYGFLIYKAVTFEHWSDFRTIFSEMNFSRFTIFVFIVILMPINWVIEAWKWQKLCSKSEKISLVKSLKAVLAGITTGYVTPNRIGEFAGRILFLSENNRWAGLILSMVNSVTQNIVMTFFGVIFAWIYFTKFNPIDNYGIYIAIVVFIIVFFAVIYFTFPDFTNKILHQRISNKLRGIIQSFTDFSFSDLVKILGISTVRYIIFCFQFFLMLHFFGIQISVFQSIVAIPTMYLFVTYTPSFSFAEPAVRGSVAVMVLSVFSNNEIGILLTGIFIWIVNFVLPMVAGSVLVMRKSAPNL